MAETKKTPHPMDKYFYQKPRPLSTTCDICQDNPAVIVCDQCNTYTFCHRCDHGFHLFPETMGQHTRHPFRPNNIPLPSSSSSNVNAQQFADLSQQLSHLLAQTQHAQQQAQAAQQANSNSNNSNNSNVSNVSNNDSGSAQVNGKRERDIKDKDKEKEKDKGENKTKNKPNSNSSNNSNSNSNSNTNSSTTTNENTNSTTTQKKKKGK